MEIKSKKIKENFARWLLKFEEQTGRPVVISLLVQRGEIEFLSCLSKRQYSALDSVQDYEVDDESPNKNVLRRLESKEDKNLRPRYIG